MTWEEKKELSVLSLKIRLGVLEGVFNAKSGHPGGSMSMADIMTYLYWKEMRIDPKDPRNPERDRFVLSKGHCAPGLYSTLAHRGFFSVDDIKTLRKTGSFLQGHPDMKSVPGVDMSSGSLGQGISAACGIALSAKLRSKNYRVYTMLGDGELEEGQVWEASMFAAHYKLDNLCVIVDNNGLQIDGPITSVCSPEPITDKFTAFGFHVLRIDAHDFNEIAFAFDMAKRETGRPTAIIARSIKGRGVSFMENNPAWHGAAPNAEQYAAAKAELEAALAAMEV